MGIIEPWSADAAGLAAGCIAQSVSRLTTLTGAPRDVRSSYSLSSPGMTATFRLYAILETDNEAASNTQTITRLA